MAVCTISILGGWVGGGQGGQGKLYAASQYTSIQFIKTFINCVSTVLGLLHVSYMYVGHIIS